MVDFGTSFYFTLFLDILFALPVYYTKLPLKIVIFRAFIHLNTPLGYLPLVYPTPVISAF